MVKEMNANEGFGNDLVWVELKHDLEERKKLVNEDSKSKMWRKFKENPLVPIGVLATTGCLSYGLYNLAKGNSRKQQLMMRGRVVAQGFTVFAAIGGLMVSIYKQIDKTTNK